MLLPRQLVTPRNPNELQILMNLMCEPKKNAKKKKSQKRKPKNPKRPCHLKNHPNFYSRETKRKRGNLRKQ